MEQGKGSSMRKREAFLTESCESFIPVSSGKKSAGGGKGGSADDIGRGCAGSRGIGVGIGNDDVDSGVT